jgi:predicted alpha/beta superfamily hydrolase
LQLRFTHLKHGRSSQRILAKEYRISVSLPASYDHAPDKTFPTVYMVDGNVFYEMVTGTARLMAMSGLIPEVIVVSVGYPLDGLYGDNWLQFFVRRSKDLTSVVDERYEEFVSTLVNDPKRARTAVTKKKDYEEFDSTVVNDPETKVETGRAESFHKFLTAELTPLVEERYRVNPHDKTLLGDSTGGHFALYSLFTEPGGFQRYVVGSPTLGYGERALFKLENAYAESYQELPARLFLGIGDQEELAPFSALGHRGVIVTVSDFYRFAAILQERGYDGLQFTKRVFTGFDHTDVPGPVFAAGLRYVFNKPRLEPMASTELENLQFFALFSRIEKVCLIRLQKLVKRIRVK